LVDFFFTIGYIDVKIDCYLGDASSTVVFNGFWFLNTDLSVSNVIMIGHLHCWKRPPVPASCCFGYFTIDPCSSCCKSFSYIWIFFTIKFTSMNYFASRFPNLLSFSYLNELLCFIVIFIDDKYSMSLFSGIFIF
jgi:hypothetical protein